jgi:hypothetical protein
LKEPVSLSRVKLIERYGVSVYNLRKLPEEIRNSKFEWTLDINAKDVLLLGEIQRKIQDARVKRIAEKKQLSKETKALASGKLICSVLQANELKRSTVLPAGKELKPFVRITIESRLPGTKPRKIGRVFNTPVSDGNPNDINAPESLIWLSPDATIDLGQFNKNEYKEGKESIIKQTHEADFFNPENSKEEPTYADVYLKFEVL